MKRQVLAALLAAATITAAMPIPAMAATNFEPTVEQNYNTAVAGQDALDGIDVTVEEQTVSAKTNIQSSKTTTLQVTGLRSEKMSADITVKADETDDQKYYRDGYIYYEGKDGKIKEEMNRETIWDKINSMIYLDMTGNYLKMLYSTTGTDGATEYHFAATQDTIANYAAKLLDTNTTSMKMSIDALTGDMSVDKDGHVVSRNIKVIYTMGEGEGAETFMKTANATFRQDGEVKVTLPSLDEYKSKADEKPAVTITPKQATIYATADLNVRSAGSLDASVIGGFSKGNGITETGYTSDGWVQVQYNGNTGYVWGEYTSNVKPVITKDSTGIMYATADVNIRKSHNTDGEILGVLGKGKSIEITGVTDNGWTRVNYNGEKAYASSSFLTWTQPVTVTYVKSADVSGMVTDASYGSLTIKANDGRTMVFDTTYAIMNYVDSIEYGDQVSVMYEGSGSPYIASSVTDHSSHMDLYAGEGEDNEYISDGIVTNYRPGEVEVSCSDGVVRTFNLTAASVDAGEIVPGTYLYISWLSNQNGSETDNIPALTVSD